MEQHPVPQNVTTFQFRLVGDMTIKQFGYLAGGIIVGYLCYKLPLPFFFTWPLAITSGLLGFGLAFVPVEERPMDVWVASFFKNVYSPTQWVWQKEKRVQKTPAVSQNLSTMTQKTVVPVPKPTPHPPKPVATQTHHPVPQTTRPFQAPHAPASPVGVILSTHQTTGLFDWFRSFFRGKPQSTPASLSPGFSFADALGAKTAPSITGKHLDLTQPQKPPPPVEKPTPTPAVSPQPPAQLSSAPRIVELQGQLSESLAQRERLEAELVAMRARMDQQAKPIQTTPLRQASVAPAAPVGTSSSVRVIAPGNETRAGLPRLTTFPNVVTGIIKDHYGNLLTGMLITVRDRDDVPLRALKTNKLGQFAASTPLPNNTYIVEIEDPKGAFVFDKAQISLTGAIAPPIEVTAKSQKQLERDKLAREIFGNTQM